MLKPIWDWLDNQQGARGEVYRSLFVAFLLALGGALWGSVAWLTWSGQKPDEPPVRVIGVRFGEPVIGEPISASVTFDSDTQHLDVAVGHRVGTFRPAPPFDPRSITSTRAVLEELWIRAGMDRYSPKEADFAQAVRAQSSVTSLGRSFTPADADQLADGRIYLVMLGWIEYRDRISRRGRVEFCSFRGKSAEVFLCASHNGPRVDSN